MANPPDTVLNTLALQSFLAALVYHGDLGLEREHYASHLLTVTKRHVGASPSQESASAFVDGLHTSDLYLTVACARPINAAWDRFTVLYKPFIDKVARNICCTACAAREIADSIPGHVFLPDASGRSRIASYEGRSSLAAWLCAVINNKALEQQRRCNCLEQLDSLPDIPDYTAFERIEVSLRAAKYASAIGDALAAAGKGLNERERFILSMKYQEELEGAEIAAILGVHPSTVSRHFRRIYEKLQAKAISTLTSSHHLPPRAIEECLDDLRDNPNHSILKVLKAGA